jgi:hypothetical protein
MMREAPHFGIHLPADFSRQLSPWSPVGEICRFRLRDHGVGVPVLTAMVHRPGIAPVGAFLPFVPNSRAFSLSSPRCCPPTRPQQCRRNGLPLSQSVGSSRTLGEGSAPGSSLQAHRAGSRICLFQFSRCRRGGRSPGSHPAPICTVSSCPSWKRHPGRPQNSAPDSTAALGIVHRHW